MVTLPSHISYALQPLDVACFKPFNTKFKKESNGIMICTNYTKLFCCMVHKALDQSIIKQTSIVDFKVCGL